ncbi:condensation domain-containing protein [Micromonospora sp. NPDC092111]|uniref:condensation domain-containing protein n=1 Tax=Micromonospora sp. NPDC092111 TaxID=3364289 RepID=UPI00380AE4FC
MTGGTQRWPLSYAQSARLARDRIHGPVPFNVNASFEVAGHLDAERLRGALDRLMRAHPALRGHLTPDGTAMLVPEEVTPELIVRTGLTADQVDAQVTAEADRFRDRRRGPLWTAQLLTRTDGHQVLALAFDHLVMDASSLDIVLTDLATGTARTPDPAGPDSYGAFAEEQHARYGGGDSPSLAYWRQHLAGTALNRPVVPTFCLDPAGPLSGRRTSTRIEFDEGEQRSLVSASAAHRVTVFMAYLAAVAAVLAESSGERDMTFRVLTHGRRPPHLRTVGWFANMVLVRLRHADPLDFASLLAEVRETWLRQLPHQGVPYPLVLRRVEPERTITDHRPAVVTVNAFTPGPPVRLGPAWLTGRPDSGGVAEEAGLHFMLGHGVDVLTIECWHDPARYAVADVADLLAALKQRLLSVADLPRPRRRRP